MIHFRCWKCHRKYQKANAKIGTTFTCSCEHVLRVPKYDYGNCRVRTLLDHLIEAALCGGGCAFIGFMFGLLLLSRFRFVVFGGEWTLLLGITAGCGLAGLVGGERVLDLIGDMTRERGP